MVNSLTPSGIKQLRQQFEANLTGRYADTNVVERILGMIEGLWEVWGDQGVPSDRLELLDAEVLPTLNELAVAPESAQASIIDMLRYKEPTVRKVVEASHP
jgi:hypothetical protein